MCEIMRVCPTETKSPEAFKGCFFFSFSCYTKGSKVKTSRGKIEQTKQYFKITRALIKKKLKMVLRVILLLLLTNNLQLDHFNLIDFFSIDLNTFI